MRARLRFTPAFVLSGMLAAGPASAEFLYVSIDGAKVPIVNESRYPGKFDAEGFSFDSTLPPNKGVATSVASVSRVLSPVVLTKLFRPASSAVFLNAIEIGEQLKGVTIDFVSTQGSSEVLNRQVRLSQVQVVGYSAELTSDRASPLLLEHISLAYRVLEIVVDGKVVVTLRGDR